MRRPGTGPRALVAGLVATAGLTIGAATPAQAAACTQGTGVTVVVGSSARCVNSSGGVARSMFTAAGHHLTDMQAQPGFVCRIDGSPAADPCVRPGTGKYWALFWSNGTSGSWTYAQSGASSLRIPKGGWVAFVYQSSSAAPSVRPIGPAPAPVTQPKPKPKPTTAPSKTVSAAPSSTPSPSASEKDDTPSASPSASPSADTSTGSAEIRRTSQEIDDRTVDRGGSSALWWTGGALALLLLVGLAVTVVQRRGKET